MSKTPKVALVILTWNQLALTLEQLQNISELKTKGLQAEAVVVDNGSTDETQKKLRNYKLPNMGFKLIRNKINLGFSGGNNVGIRYALKKDSDYIILLNNDLILPSDLLLHLIKVAESDNKIGLVAPKMYFAKGYEYHKDRYKAKDLGKVIWYAGGIMDWDNIYSSHRGVDEVDRGQYEKQEQTEYVNGACALVKRKVFEEVGVFDERYFLYWEDADLSQRAKKKGWKVIYTPSTHLWHKVSQASGIGSNLNDYFITRNRMLFGMQYARMRTKIALLRESVKLLLKGRPWQKTAIKDFYLGRYGKGSWK